MKKSEETTYNGHTWCRKCGHTHWMHGACVDPPKIKLKKIKQEKKEEPSFTLNFPQVSISGRFETYVKDGFTYRDQSSLYKIEAQIKNGKIINPILVCYYSAAVPIDKVMRKLESLLGLKEGSIKTN